MITGDGPLTNKNPPTMSAITPTAMSNFIRHPRALPAPTTSVADLRKYVSELSIRAGKSGEQSKHQEHQRQYRICTELAVEPTPQERHPDDRNRELEADSDQRERGRLPHSASSPQGRGRGGA